MVLDFGGGVLVSFEVDEQSFFFVDLIIGTLEGLFKLGARNLLLEHLVCLFFAGAGRV